MQIVDNFLQEKDFNLIKDTMSSDYFPWYLASIVKNDTNNLKNKEFAHVFFLDDKINSSFYYLIEPILNKLTIKKLLRIRAALMPAGYQDESVGWHIDTKQSCTTAIYYINNNNGYTLLKNNYKVNSLENRFFSFNSQIEHTGVRCTDDDFRMLINFNYIS